MFIYDIYTVHINLMGGQVMRGILISILLALGATAANAEGFSIARLLDPLGLFQQTSMEGLLDERGTAGARYEPDGTRGGGEFLKARPNGGGKIIKQN